MLEFIKYPSLTNVASKNFISAYKSINNIDDELFFATEKVDGTNISFEYDVPSGNSETYRRNGKANLHELPYSALNSLTTEHSVRDFINNLALLVDTYVGLVNINPFDRIRLPLNMPITKLRFYGELYGAGIQKHDYDISKNDKKVINHI